MLAAPLIAGNDVRHMPPSIAAILLNRDVIAIGQDRRGKQAKRVFQSGEHEIWVRDLVGGDFAAALFNRAQESASITFDWVKAGLKKRPSARELWSHSEVKLHGNIFSADVPGHGCCCCAFSSAYFAGTSISEMQISVPWLCPTV